MSKWIKCEDRLPEEDGLVLTTNKDGVGVGYFNEHYKNWDTLDGDDYFADLEFFTHWQPLPEPPTKE